MLKELYANYLLSNGIDEKHFIYIALDDFDNSHLWNPVELNKYIRSLIVDNQMYYIVVDEIQNVFDIKNPIFTNGKIVKAKKTDEDKLGFIQIALGLMKIENVDLYYW